MKLSKMYFLVCLMLVFSVIFSSASVFAETNMFLGSAFDQNHIIVEMGYKFKDLVEEYSDGEIKVEISAGAALGGEKELVEQTSSGTIDGTLTGALQISSYANEYFFVKCPFLFKDFKSLQNMWNSDLGKKMRDTMIENGNIRMLDLMYRGMRHTTSNIPFYTPEEMEKEKVKIRVPILPSWVAVWEEMGAQVTTIDLNELFSSVQRGIADATEGPTPQILTTHLDEVQDYLIMTNHVVSFGDICLNEEFYQRLTNEQKEIVNRASKEACAWATAVQRKRENKEIVELQKKGMQVIIPDTKAFAEATKPAMEELFEEKWVSSYEEVQKYNK